MLSFITTNIRVKRVNFTQRQRVLHHLALIFWRDSHVGSVLLIRLVQNCSSQPVRPMTLVSFPCRKKPISCDHRSLGKPKLGHSTARFWPSRREGASVVRTVANCGSQEGMLVY